MEKILISNFYNLLLAWIILGISTFVFLIFSKINTPYGRHSKRGWGIMVNNAFAWFWMEFPALVIMPSLVMFGPNRLNPLSILLATIWFCHYFNRVIIYPMRIKTKNKKMPITIALSAFFFNIFNGFFTGFYIGFINHDSMLFNYNTVIGLLLFLFGMIININSDNILISLRKTTKGYKVPMRGFFKFVSCPNYFGEIIEWTGFFVIFPNLAAFSFLLWTCCNLIPRAINHHNWYLKNFNNYPKERKIIFPFIL